MTFAILLMLFLGLLQLIRSVLIYLTVENRDTRKAVKYYWFGVCAYFFILFVLVELLEFCGREWYPLFQGLSETHFFVGALGIAALFEVKLGTFRDRFDDEPRTKNESQKTQERIDALAHDAAKSEAIF